MKVRVVAVTVARKKPNTVCIKNHQRRLTDKNGAVRYVKVRSHRRSLPKQKINSDPRQPTLMEKWFVRFPKGEQTPGTFAAHGGVGDGKYIPQERSDELKPGMVLVANVMALASPLNDPSVQNQALQQKCWGVNVATKNLHACQIVFCSILPVPRPVLSTLCTVDDNDWRQVMSIVLAYGSGNNTVMDKWVSTRQLTSLYRYIFRQPFPYHKWNITGVRGLGQLLAGRLSLWTDACDYDYVKLPRNGHSAKTVVFPRYDWYLHTNNQGDQDWFDDYNDLRSEVENHLCLNDYLSVKMHKFMRLVPAATMAWISDTRTEIYCILVCYYPLGVDTDALFETYRKLFHHNLGSDLNGAFDGRMLIGHIIDDISVFVRESQMHSLLYPIFYHGLQIPERLMVSRRIKKTVTTTYGQGASHKTVITVNGCKVPQKRCLQDHLCQ